MNTDLHYLDQGTIATDILFCPHIYGDEIRDDIVVNYALRVDTDAYFVCRFRAASRLPSPLIDPELIVELVDIEKKRCRGLYSDQEAEEISEDTHRICGSDELAIYNIEEALGETLNPLTLEDTEIYLGMVQRNLRATFGDPRRLNPVKGIDFAKIHLVSPFDLDNIAKYNKPFRTQILHAPRSLSALLTLGAGN